VVMTPLWTQVDIDKLRVAIVALGSGESVQSVTYAGPPARTLVYQPQDLKEMRDLLAQIVAEVRSATRRPYRVATFRKGV